MGLSIFAEMLEIGVIIWDTEVMSQESSILFRTLTWRTLLFAYVLDKLHYLALQPQPLCLADSL